jgi:hypothetical protein
MSKKLDTKKSFLDLYKDEHYKKAMIDALSQGINSEYLYSFKSLLEYVVNEKYHLFDREEFKGALYLEEDETLDLVLPAVRRVFGKIFIDPPTLFKETGYNNGSRYKLFTMYFNPDEFIDYLIDMFAKSKDCLHHFEHIDRTAETLTLIVDNYVAGLVQRVIDIEDYEQAIQNILTQHKREEVLNQIFEENKDELL